MKWSELRRPKWIIGSVVVVLIATLFLNLAAWQFDRLAERKALNVRLRAANSQPAQTVTSVGQIDSAIPYRKVHFKAVLDDSQLVYVRYPIRDGAMGYNVVYPVSLSDGKVLVNFGWIPLEAGKTKALQPSHQRNVDVVGIVRENETIRGVASHNDATPAVPTVTANNPRAIAELFHENINQTYWIAVTEPNDFAAPLEVPEITEGPHFSYALQWIAFTLIGVVGWLILVWRGIRKPTD